MYIYYFAIFITLLNATNVENNDKANNAQSLKMIGFV